MSNIQDIDLKLIIVGDFSVGKTSLINTIFGEIQEASPTIGVDFFTKIYNIRETNVRVKIWDTAGQERYRSMSKSYFTNSNCAMLVYDVTNPKTFDNVDLFYSMIRSLVEREIPIALIANKIDKTNRIITTQQGREKSYNLDCLYFETSTINGNIDNIITTLMDTVLKNLNFKNIDNEDRPIIQKNTRSCSRCF